MEETKQVDDVIKKVISDIKSKIKNIRRGGCAVFAYEAAIALTEAGIKFKIMGMGHREDGEDMGPNNRELDAAISNIEKGNIKTLYRVTIVPSHFVIKIGDKYMDGESFGKGFLPDGMYEEREYTIEELKLAKEYGKYNDAYNTEQDTEVHDIVTKDFEPLTHLNK